MIAWSKEQKQDAKADQSSSDIAACVNTALRLHAEGKYPTVRAMSLALKHGADWAQGRLEAAVNRGLLRRTSEHVPRTQGMTDVYRPIGLVDGAISPEDPLAPTSEPTT